MTTLDRTARDHLTRLVDQIERLEEEKKALAADISDKLKEAKGLGFDVKTLRQVLRLRKQSSDERETAQTMLEVYMHALGMLADTPLGQAAVAREFGARADA